MTQASDDRRMDGPGRQLQAAREAAGLGVTEVAEQLQLLPSFVRGLEQNNYERMRGETFVRGYLHNYARLLDLDPQEIVAAYRQARTGGRPSASRGATAARKALHSTSGAGRIGMVVLLLAASVLYLFHNRAPATPDMTAPDLAVTVETGAGARVVPLAAPEHDPRTDDAL